MKMADSMTWNLSLLYSGLEDPRIEKDVMVLEESMILLEKKYKNRKFITSPSHLFAALEHIEKVQSTIAESRPLLYLFLLTEIQANNDTARALLAKYEQRLTVAANKLVFFDLTIGTIPKEQQKTFLSYPPLKKYRYMLERIFLQAKYMLSEKEEQLVGLLAQPGTSFWVDTSNKLRTAQVVLHKGKKIPLSQAEDILKELPRGERYRLYKNITAAYKESAVVAEGEINAIITYKKILDEKRGYNAVTTAALVNHELDEQTVEIIVRLVETYTPYIRRFYALHAKLLGLEKLSYADRQVSIGRVRERFDFKKTVHLVREAFNKAGGSYVQLLDQFLSNGQIDVFPRVYKKSGGYCVGTIGNPTFILLNHTDDLHSAETLAHEMGHAFHTEYAQKQPEHYRHYTTATAEVASTFFEQLFADHITEKLSGKEAIIYLHGKILRDITTIFRQTAFYSFEKELHEMAAGKGYLSSLEIQQLLVAHMSQYLGQAFHLADDDGLQYVSWSHLRTPFYTISYAYGMLVSKGLYASWKKDAAYIEKVEEFMSAGGSASPRDIFKQAGIDTADPSFFEAGLKDIVNDIKKLERLVKKENLL